MAYLKPPTFLRKVINPLAMRTGIGGTTALVVRRRRSGGTQTVPVVPIEHDGVRYVVSARGESEWVRNLRAAGRLELGGRSYAASEVPVSEREPIIGAYRAKAGRSVASFWRALPRDEDHPTFRLEPV